MRKHIILFFSALLFLFACNRSKTPDGLLPDDVFIRLLADVHIIDGSLMNEQGPDSLFKNGTGRYMQVFKQYHTDSATFKKTMRYYVLDNERMIKIYDGVDKIIKKKTDSVNAIQNAIAQKELERLQKQSKDVDATKKAADQRERDRLELINQETLRREKEKVDKEQQQNILIEKARQDAKRRRDSINNAAKKRAANKKIL